VEGSAVPVCEPRGGKCPGAGAAPAQAAPLVTCSSLVVGTGIDSVISCISGARSTNTELSSTNTSVFAPAVTTGHATSTVGG